MSFFSEVQQQWEVLNKVVSHYYEGTSAEGEKYKTLLKDKNIKKIVFTGMGSSLFAAYVPCAYLQKKGYHAHAYESCELIRFSDGLIDDTTLIIAVSQSGESRETVAAARFFDERYTVITVTNSTNATLNNYGKLNFPIFAEKEETSANKTYTNTLAVLMYLAYSIANTSSQELETAKNYLNGLSTIMRSGLESIREKISEITSKMLDIKYIAVIGSGPSYSTACQGELLLIEAIKQYSASFTVNQFMHGPLEIIDGNFGAFVLDFDKGMRDEVDLLIQLVTKFGGKLIIISNRDIVTNDQIFTVKIDCTDHPLSPVIEMFPIELYLNEMGTRKNIKPGILTRTDK